MWKLIIHIFILATIHLPIATLTPVMPALAYPLYLDRRGTEPVLDLICG